MGSCDSQGSVCCSHAGEAVQSRGFKKSSQRKLSRSAAKQLGGCLNSQQAVLATRNDAKPLEKLAPSMEAVMEQVRLGVEQGPCDSNKAAERLQEFVAQQWENQEHLLSGAREAVGHSIGMLTEGEQCKFSAAVKSLFRSVLKPEVDSIHGAIELGHLKLSHPDKDQREALTAKIFNVLTTAHILVSVMLISGEKIAAVEGSLRLTLGEHPSPAKQLLLSIAECAYKVSSAVRAKVVSSLNILLEKHFADDAAMLAHMALMRWSYPSATAWEQHASAAEAKPAERPLQERDSNLSAGGLSRLPSQGFMSQGYLTNSFSKGLSMSEAGKDRKRSSNWINKSNEARLRDLRAKGDRIKRRSRISSSVPRKPNAVVKAHHHIVPRFPKPVQVADKRQRDPSKRAVLAGKCKQPEGIIGDTPYVPRSVQNPMDVIPDTDARPRGDSSQFSFDTRCKRHLDFGEEPLPAVEFSERDLEIMSECNQVLAQPVRQGTIFAQYARQM